MTEKTGTSREVWHAWMRKVNQDGSQVYARKPSHCRNKRVYSLMFRTSNTYFSIVVPEDVLDFDIECATLRITVYVNASVHTQ